MKSVPPEVSREWCAGERLDVIEWIVGIALDRIQRDDPTVPFLAKDQVRELFRALAFLTSETASVLEQYRAILLKPYDAARDHHGVLVPEEVLDMLRQRVTGNG